MQEKIIETKICKHCNSNFEITDKDLEFYEKISPVFVGKKYSIPTPTFCPDCRQQRRLSFRNERKLYRRKCDLCEKNGVSIFSPDKQNIVYCNDCWWSDKWDPLYYGKDFDFGYSFFEQFHDLFRITPVLNLKLLNCENSDYCGQLTNSKDCYLSFLGDKNENCIYNYLIFGCNNCVDCFDIHNCTDCYYCFQSHNLFNCDFLTKSKSSNNCYLGYKLNNCNNCLGCRNLNDKSFYILNKEYDKEEYLKLKEKFLKDSEFLKKFDELKKSLPHINLDIVNSKNSIGDNIYNSKNTFLSFDTDSTEDLKYCFNSYSHKNCYDCIGGTNAELCYDSQSLGNNNFNVQFSFGISDCKNSQYLGFCINCSDCFGCISLRNKSYCILNKQYTKEQYEELVPKIIEHMTSPQPSPTGEGEGAVEWGEFFPSSISPFGYNETVANEYFPIIPPPIPNPFPPREKGNSTFFSFSLGGKDAGKADRGTLNGSTYKPTLQDEINNSPLLVGEGSGVRFNRSTYEPPFPKVAKIIPASKLPDNISDIPDDILNRAIECEITKKPFKIIRQELEFYKKHNLPIPKRHPDQRHLDRMALRNPRKLFDRKCDKCGIEIKTTYNKKRPEIVYCENCYNKEVY